MLDFLVTILILSAIVFAISGIVWLMQGWRGTGALIATMRGGR